MTRREPMRAPAAPSTNRPAVRHNRPMGFIKSALVLVGLFWGLVLLVWLAWKIHYLAGTLLFLAIPLVFFATRSLWKRKD